MKSRIPNYQSFLRGVDKRNKDTIFTIDIHLPSGRWGADVLWGEDGRFPFTPTVTSLRSKHLLD